MIIANRIRQKCYNLVLKIHYNQKQNNWIKIVYYWTVPHSGINYICRPTPRDFNFNSLKTNMFAHEYKKSPITYFINI